MATRDRFRRGCKLRRVYGYLERKGAVWTDTWDISRAAKCTNAPRDIGDLRKLPITTKADLREHYPLGFLAVSRAEVARFHGSSGTTGKPTFVAYTAEDLVTWSNLCARFLIGGGLKPEHTVHIAFGYGLFTGGFGLHYGVERVGAAIVPAASGNTRRQIMLIQDMQPDALVCTPSYALTIADTARELGIDPRSLSIKYAHFGGEPWTEDMRVAIEQQLGILAKWTRIIR